MASGTTDSELQATLSPGHGAYPISLSTSTTAGFIGRAERGPVDQPVCIRSFSEYYRYFGGHLADGALSHSVHDFFLHGGRQAVIVRITNRARRAQLDVPTEDGMLSLRARNPGRHEILRISVDYEEVEKDPERFNLIVQRLGASGNRLVEDQEFYPLVSVSEHNDRYIRQVMEESSLIELAGPVPSRRPLATPPERPGAPVRYVGLTVAGEDGDELSDYDFVGSNRDGTGLFAFDRGPRIDLLSIPLLPEKDLGTTVLVAAARYCEARRALLIWDPPCSWQSVDSAMLGARQLGFASGHVMTYFPRVRPRGAKVRYAGGMAAAGAIAGMLAQRDRRGVFGRQEDGDYSLRATLTPVLDLSMSDAQRLARYGINTFVRARAGMTKLIGRVTLGSSALSRGPMLGLDTRRVECFVLSSIQDAAVHALQDNQTKDAVDCLEWQIRRFLSDLQQRGGLPGKRPEQAGFVQRRLDGTGASMALRVGIALRGANLFDEYTIALSGVNAGQVQRATDTRAAQSVA